MILDIINGKFFYLFVGASAIVGYAMMTLFLNWSMGVTWSRDIWPQIKGGNYAVAIYFAAVRLGTCLLIAGAILAGAIL